MRSHFTVHPLVHRPGHAMIAQDGRPFLTVDNVAAANLLADLLEKTSAIDDAIGHVLGDGDEELGRQRIATAIARSLGHSVRHDQGRLPGHGRRRPSLQLRGSVAVKALTVWQPWATLIAEEAKPWEFRGWRVPNALVGQRIAIHAAARPMNQVEIALLLDQLYRGENRGGLVRPLAIEILQIARLHPERFPLSHVVCTAIVGEALSPREIAPLIGVELNDSDRDDHFNFAWPMKSVEKIAPPAPARGRQGFWTWNEVTP